MTMSTATWVPRAQYDPMSDQADPAPKPKKRKFTAQYKRDVLAEYEAQTRCRSKRGSATQRRSLLLPHRGVEKSP